MWLQFLWQNLHFATNLFTALAFFSIFWLYLDAWIDRKTIKEGFKISGFLLLSLSFLVHSTLIESAGITTSIFSRSFSEEVTMILRNSGYLLLIVGLLIDPLIPKPVLAAFVIPTKVATFLLSPILATTAAWLYLRRATIGLENHTKKVSLAFFILALHELLTVPVLFKDSLNIDIFRLVSPFGTLWIVAHVVQIIGAGILILWAFSYLLKRINTQLFIIFTTTTLSIFLLTTISFTFLLLKNLSAETLTRLKTDVDVLSFSLDSKKIEGSATATILAQNPKISEAIVSRDRKTLAEITQGILLSQKVSGIVIIDETGQVLARGEDRDRIGDSLSNHNLIKRALNQETVTSLATIEGAMSPNVIVQAVEPIKKDNKLVGVAMVTILIDNNFLDGIKKVSGLEMGIYGGDVLSATTISDLRGTTRPVGIKLTDQKIKNSVLTKGEDYSGVVSLLNTSYFAAYLPLKDVNNEVVGMLLGGRPAVSIYTTASKSIELTFIVTVFLIIISTPPSFLISKYIFGQLK